MTQSAALVSLPTLQRPSSRAEVTQSEGVGLAVQSSPVGTAGEQRLSVSDCVTKSKTFPQVVLCLAVLSLNCGKRFLIEERQKLSKASEEDNGLV